MEDADAATAVGSQSRSSLPGLDDFLDETRMKALKALTLWRRKRKRKWRTKSRF
jgi:hypothetical protein